MLLAVPGHAKSPAGAGAAASVAPDACAPFPLSLRDQGFCTDYDLGGKPGDGRVEDVRMAVLRTIAAIILIPVLAGGPAADTGAAERGSSAAVPGDAPPARAAGTRWSWPVGPPAAVARPFVAPPTPYGRGHRGVDLVAGARAEVRAPDAGTVRFAGWVVDRPVLSIDHGGGLVSSFEPVDPVVDRGEHVQRGQVVGLLVAGHCADGCLHLGARLHGEYVNPLLFLGGVPRAILLPVRR